VGAGEQRDRRGLERGPRASLRRWTQDDEEEVQEELGSAGSVRWDQAARSTRVKVACAAPTFCVVNYDWLVQMARDRPLGFLGLETLWDTCTLWNRPARDPTHLILISQAPSRSHSAAPSTPRRARLCLHVRAATISARGVHLSTAPAAAGLKPSSTISPRRAPIPIPTRPTLPIPYPRCLPNCQLRGARQMPSRQERRKQERDDAKRAAQAGEPRELPPLLRT